LPPFKVSSPAGRGDNRGRRRRRGVGAGIAEDLVVIGRADDVLDAVEVVVAGAAGGEARGEVDEHFGAGARIARRVDPAAAVEAVVAVAALEHVVAVDGVGRERGPHVGISGDRSGRAGIVRVDDDPAVAVEDIVARAAGDYVVPLVAGEDVGAAVADQGVVAVGP
jgi:hypothetical protein